MSMRVVIHYVAPLRAKRYGLCETVNANFPVYVPMGSGVGFACRIVMMSTLDAAPEGVMLTFGKRSW